MSVTLRQWTSDGVTLETGLAQAAPALGAQAFALLTGRNGCRFAEMAAGGQGFASPPPPDVYAARVFSPLAELRWWWPTGATPRAALLSVDDRLAGPEQWRETTVTTGAQRFELRYLLWGRAWSGAPEPKPGWTTLTEPRIGALAVPCAAVRQNGRVQLVAYEVHAPPDQDGNVTVAGELLSHIKAGNQQPADPLPGGRAR